MQSMYSKYRDDFLDGSETVYNYAPSTNYKYLFYAQIVGIQRIGPNYYNELAMAKEYLIQYTVEGNGSASINDEKLILKKGDLLIIPNYHHHIFEAIENQPWTIAFIHIYENDSVMEIFNRVFLKHRYLIRNVNESNIVPYIKNIISLYKSVDNRDSNKELMISNQIYQLLMEICAQSNVFETDNVDKKLASVIHYINQNFNTPMTLKDILAHSIYSKNHLERLFKEKMNMTMQSYVAKLRLKRAQELILTTNLYFHEIALQIGLKDYRSLHYLFTNTIGMTPAEFRNRKLTITS